MDNRNRKYPIIHLCLGELGPHHPENLLCLGEAGSLHPEILYCPGEADSRHLIIYLCPGEPSSRHLIILYCSGEPSSHHPEILLCSGKAGSLHLEIHLCPGEVGSPKMPAPGRAREAERDGGRRSPPNPFVYRVLDSARPGKNIRGLQHPQLGEVLVDLEKLITQNAGCFAPQETNVRVIIRGS